MSLLSVRLAGRLGAFALDVAFAAGPGVTALLGPSGAGKTSVLRCIAGLERLTGEVRLGDTVWQDGRRFVPAHRRRIGCVFQGANLLPHLDVAANLAFATRRAPDPADLDEIVARTGIGPLLRREPARLSGGEAQRVAIARALLLRPALLLLDEPLSALDGAAKEELIALLEWLLPALAVPAILVTHDLRDVARLADRRILLRAGRIEETATLA